MLFAGLVLGFSVTANVEYRLEAPATISLSGPAPNLKLEVHNRRSKSIPFWRTWFYNNHVVSLVDLSGNPVTLTQEGKRRLDAFPNGPRWMNISGRIDPNSTFIDPVDDFRVNFKLKPGTYRLRIEYRDLGEELSHNPNLLSYGDDVRLVSNEVAVNFIP